MIWGLTRILTFSSLIWLSHTASSGTVALFLDRECTRASGTNTSVKVSANECLATSGALGVAIQTLPQCDSGGKASFYVFADPACASSSGSPYDFSFCVKNGAKGVAAIGAVCGGDAKGFVASTTVTVSASSPTAGISASATGGSAASTTPAGAVPTQTPSTDDNANLSHGLHLPIAAWIGIGIGAGAVALLATGLILYRLIFSRTPANQRFNGQEMKPFPTTVEASWFPLHSRPQCPRCLMPGRSDVVRFDNPIGNVGRPYYTCENCKQDPRVPTDSLGRKGWITWDDTKGLPVNNFVNNPTCRCGFLARQDRSRRGNGFWVCCVGQCGYLSWSSDGIDGATGNFQPWLL